MTSVRLPENINMQLEQLCERTNRTKSFHIKAAIARYLEDIGDHYIAMDRIYRPKRKLPSTAEIISEN